MYQVSHRYILRRAGKSQPRQGRLRTKVRNCTEIERREGKKGEEERLLSDQTEAAGLTAHAWTGAVLFCACVGGSLRPSPPSSPGALWRLLGQQEYNMAAGS